VTTCFLTTATTHHQNGLVVAEEQDSLLTKSKQARRLKRLERRKHIAVVQQRNVHTPREDYDAMMDESFELAFRDFLQFSNTPVSNLKNLDFDLPFVVAVDRQ
jgi:hypothetical protein